MPSPPTCSLPSPQEERDVAQMVERIDLYGGSILYGGCICSLGYFPFEPVVHNGSINGCDMCL